MLRTNRTLFGLCTLFAFALSASLVIAQYDKKDDKGGMKMPQPGTPEAAAMQKEMEAKMMEAGTPGPEHKEMAKNAGTWDADIKFLDFATGQWSPPMKGTMKMEPVMDGRYMMMAFEGTMEMGGQSMPFKGMGIQGYDNIKKKYFSTWIDSMSTAFMKSEGTKTGNTITLMGTMPNPQTGQDMKSKEVVTQTDADHMKFEMHCDMGGGEQMKMMEINYTRKK